MEYTPRTIEERQTELDLVNDGISKTIERFAKSPDLLVDYVRFCQRFEAGSFRNNLLIYQQYPNAQYVLPCKLYNEMGYRVKKGEKGLKVLRGNTYYMYQFEERGAWWTKKNIMDILINPNSTVNDLDEAQNKLDKIKHKNYFNCRTGVTYSLISVFDIAQTNCPKEDYLKIFNAGFDGLTNDVIYNSLLIFASNIIHKEVKEKNLDIDINKHTVFDDEIIINSAEEDTQKISNLIQKIGETIVLNKESSIEKSDIQLSFEIKFFEVIVKSYLGLDVSDEQKANLVDKYSKIIEFNKNAPENEKIDIPHLMDGCLNDYYKIKNDLRKEIENQLDLELYAKYDINKYCYIARYDPILNDLTGKTTYKVAFLNENQVIQRFLVYDGFNNGDSENSLNQQERERFTDAEIKHYMNSRLAPFGISSLRKENKEVTFKELQGMARAFYKQTMSEKEKTLKPPYVKFAWSDCDEIYNNSVYSMNEANMLLASLNEKHRNANKDSKFFIVLNDAHDTFNDRMLIGEFAKDDFIKRYVREAVQLEREGKGLADTYYNLAKNFYDACDYEVLDNPEATKREKAVAKQNLNLRQEEYELHKITSRTPNENKIKELKMLRSAQEKADKNNKKREMEV